MSNSIHNQVSHLCVLLCQLILKRLFLDSSKTYFFSTKVIDRQLSTQFYSYIILTPLHNYETKI